MTKRRERVVALVAVVSAALSAACSSDDTASSSSTRAPTVSTSELATPTTSWSSSTSSPGTTGTTETTTATTATTATTETPPTTAPQMTEPPDPAVEADRQLRGLIADYQAVIEAILADPRVAGNPDDPLVQQYLALFAPDNQFPIDTLAFWASEGSAGRFYRPGPSGVMYEIAVLSVEVRDDGTAVAYTCTRSSVQIVDEAGNPIEGRGGLTGGEVVAVTAGGAWLLRDLSQVSADRCPTRTEGT